LSEALKPLEFFHIRRVQIAQVALLGVRTMTQAIADKIRQGGFLRLGGYYAGAYSGGLFISGLIERRPSVHMPLGS